MAPRVALVGVVSFTSVHDLLHIRRRRCGEAAFDFHQAAEQQRDASTKYLHQYTHPGGRLHTGCTGESQAAVIDHL